MPPWRTSAESALGSLEPRAGHGPGGAEFDFAGQLAALLDHHLAVADAAGHLAGGDLQGGEQGRGAVADVVVAGARRGADQPEV